MEKIILASASPRRKELLSVIVPNFDVVVSEVKEIITSTDPAKVTMELSLQKAKSVDGKNRIVIGADTVVSLDGNIFGKPSNQSEAYEMIRSLQGRTHQVFTGVTIIKDESLIGNFFVKTDVIVAKMSEVEINEYINTEEPYDKAGAYGIQGLFGKHVEGIIGDYNNVVGLPICRLYEELKCLGV